MPAFFLLLLFFFFFFLGGGGGGGVLSRAVSLRNKDVMARLPPAPELMRPAFLLAATKQTQNNDTESDRAGRSQR